MTPNEGTPWPVHWDLRGKAICSSGNRLGVPICSQGCVLDVKAEKTGSGVRMVTASTGSPTAHLNVPGLGGLHDGGGTTELPLAVDIGVRPVCQQDLQHGRRAPHRRYLKCEEPYRANTNACSKSRTTTRRGAIVNCNNTPSRANQADEWGHSTEGQPNTGVNRLNLFYEAGWDTFHYLYVKNPLTKYPLSTAVSIHLQNQSWEWP